jgi:hypothetical protein
MPVNRNTQFDPLTDWRRNATVKALAAVADRDTHQIAKHLYGAAGSAIALKAAVNPASTDGWGGELAASRVGAFLKSLRPKSAAAELFARGVRIDLVRTRTIILPRLHLSAPLTVVPGSI